MLPDRIATVRERIAEACRSSGRSPDEVMLVAVTKTVPLDVVREARACGIEHFAENYAKELAAKSTRIPATWHFVGKLQRGTAARVADHADVIHSAEPGRALEHVGDRAARAGRRIPCLVQVDFTKARQGVSPEELPAFVEAVAEHRGVTVIGLMTLPPWAEDPEASRPYFARLRDLRDRLGTSHPTLRELSMGMSADYEVAVEEGATMVRVGTALFGLRPKT
jgi:pyridoxal phosphate enzyme (YggS family)